MPRQVPPSHRGDTHKIEFIQNAVIGQHWDKEPLRQAVTAELSFQKLYAELEISVQFKRERKAALLTIKWETENIPRLDPVSSIHFSEQGNFIRHNHATQKTQKNKMF